MTVVLGFIVFALSCIIMIVASLALWLILGAGLAIFFCEDHDADADWRIVAITVCIIAIIGQIFVLKTADALITAAWHAIIP